MCESCAAASAHVTGEALRVIVKTQGNRAGGGAVLSVNTLPGDSRFFFRISEDEKKKKVTHLLFAHY